MIRALIILAVICAFNVGCAPRGGAGTPETGKTSAATESIIDQKVAAATAMDDAKVKALAEALADQNKAEINGELRWLIALGVLAMAAGAGLLYFGAAKLGGGFIVTGASLIAGSFIVTSLLPYLLWFGLAAVAAGLGALVWYLWTHVRALRHVDLGTALPAAKHVAAVIARIRGPIIHNPASEP